jgi:FtsH-binding integral membrane protein
MTSRENNYHRANDYPSPPPYTQIYSDYSTLDEEAQTEYSYLKGGFIKEKDESDQLKFIRKVFGILTIQLLVTLAFVILFVSCKPLSIFVAHNLWLLLLSSVITFSLILLTWCGDLVRHTKGSIIFLSLITFFQGFTVGALCSFYNASVVFLSVGITTALVASLMLFALQTKYSYLGAGPYLWLLILFLLFFSLVISLISFTNVLSYAQIKILHLIVSLAFMLLFSFFIVYDTQCLLKGDHNLREKEHIFVSIV